MIHNDYLELGGEYFSVRSEAEGLRAAGVDVELLLASNSQIAESNLWQKVTALTLQRDAYGLVSDAIDRYKPDLVHAQNLFPALGAGAIRALADAGIPWVRTLRNYRLACIGGDFRLDGDDCYLCESSARAHAGVRRRCYRDSRTQSIGAVAYARAERRASASHQPSAYLVLSRWMVSALQPVLDGVTVHVHPNIVPTASVAPAPKSERRFAAAFVGRLASNKGPDFVIEVAALRPDLQFAIAGSGPLAKQLETARPNVKLLGEISHPEALKLMANSVATLVPSRWDEPFGRVAAEALSVGTCPIVLARGGLPDIVDGLDDSLVQASLDPRQWAESLGTLCSLTDARYSRLTEACIRVASERYSASALTASLIRIYETVLPR
ncbi:glycosyltransferase involved in cell wall biosynthesis [Ilumatobacter fluminis]|uniref:Glycosyltransferase involved in cell wall biosynthesis n=2 Tax=Ilumatobacter fluminis TaxID=467091 RepID=A0A4R7I4F5_9ACTN|nr:glycosyltransferase involved in cell wall biosynthesis [Ilumatobacter fluminis]